MIGVMLTSSVCFGGELRDVVGNVIRQQIAKAMTGKEERIPTRVVMRDVRGVDPASVMVNGQSLPEVGNPEPWDVVVEDAGAWIKKGKDFGEAGQWQESLMCFQRAIEKEPSNIEAHYCAGIVYERMGQEENARQELARLQQAKEQLEVMEKKLKFRIESALR